MDVPVVQTCIKISMWFFWGGGMDVPRHSSEKPIDLVAVLGMAVGIGMDVTWHNGAVPSR